MSQLIDENFPNATSEIGSATPSINIIPPTDEKINTFDEKNSKPLNDEDPPIADNNEKHTQHELRATLEAKVADVVSVLKISQKEKILPTVTPQNTFDDIPKDLSINSITENFEKVNTSDEKNP